MRPRAVLSLLALLPLSAACGQWSGAPVTSVEPQPIPLGPGPTVVIARDAGAAGGAAIDSWADTVVVSWIRAEPGAGSAAVLAATSGDAGSSFGTPVRLGAFHDAGPSMTRGLGVGVAAPDAGSRSRAPRVWVRAAPGGDARTLTWHSRNGGRTFVELEPHQQAPDTVFPAGWGPVDGSTPGSPGTLRIVSRGSQGQAWPQDVPMPPGAQGAPAVVVDEHGALALLWRERDEAGAVSLVVRRAWVDWNANGGEAPGFDAAYTLARLADAASEASIARVPGGVIVSWFDRGTDGTSSVFARRLGMDMTCTRESAPPAVTR